MQYYPLSTLNTDKYTFLPIPPPIIEFIRVKNYYGIPKGHSLSIYTCFLAKREIHCTFLWKKMIIIIYIQHGTTIFFSHYYLFLGKLKEKLARKARVNTERVYRIVLMPLGHHIILYSLNMAATSVKRSIDSVLKS